jgi:peptidoglycan/LPS O-acetylase OafA/YrhL
VADTEALKSKQGPSKTQRPRRILRRIGAVLAGLLVVVILDTGIDVVLHATGIYPPWFKPMRTSLWLLAIAYRMVDGVAGGYIVARLAPDRPVQHALVLGVIGIVLSIVGVIGTFNRGPEFGPIWYPLALVVVALPCAWLGGRLRASQISPVQNQER